jgi:putative CocE/NonD family hydrolase
MSFISRIFAKIAKLPLAETYDIAVDKDILVPMKDGVNLHADRYYPRNLGSRPTVLIRSPYGRKMPLSLMFGRIIAERGFQVLIQSCRGTANSEGDFNPFRQEHDDGMATIEWLRTQSWYTGELATMGPSYLGLSQWSIASEIGSELKAMSTWVTSSEFRSLIYPGNAFHLELALRWGTSMYQERQQPSSLLQRLFSSDKKLNVAYRHLPLEELDKIVVDNQISYWQDWLVHERPDDEWWANCDFTRETFKVTAPNNMVSGWYDIFLPHTFRDYRALVAAGQKPQLTIGPWMHNSPELVRHSLSTTINWLRKYLLNEENGAKTSPIHIYIMGADTWRDLDVWPPEQAKAQAWYLHAGGGLSPEISTHSVPDHYRYDPANPTPNIGGASLGKVNGPKDNREIEARDDVMVYSSAVIEKDLEVIGNVTAELYLRSSLEYTDFFARLCDVDLKGKSTNICDGLIRLFPGAIDKDDDGIFCLKIELWPTAYRFKKGHRIRVQVSSGAFPRWARNMGGGEKLGTASQFKIAEQTIYHDPEHPSAVVLSVLSLN